MFKRVLAAAVMLLAVSGVQAEELKVAVAANFAHTLGQITKEFEAQTGHKVRVSSGSTGALYTQIQHGAPFDLFLAADKARPQRLEREDKILPGSRTTYAIGQLAYWQRSGTPGAESLSHWQGKLALANPRLAPYGAAAMEAMSKLGIRDAFKGRTVTGNNILQTYQYVDSGNVKAGMVALSQLRAAGVPQEQYWVIPDSYHAPLEQQAVILKRTAQPELAQQLLTFISQQQSLLTDAGYQVSAYVASR